MIDIDRGGQFGRALELDDRNIPNTRAFLESDNHAFTLHGYEPPEGYSLRKSADAEHYRLIKHASEPTSAYIVEGKPFDGFLTPADRGHEVRVFRRIFGGERGRAFKDLGWQFIVHLSRCFPIVIPNSERTRLQGRFWEYRLAHAAEMPGMYLYYCEQSTAGRTIQRIEGYRQYNRIDCDQYRANGIQETRSCFCL